MKNRCWADYRSTLDAGSKEAIDCIIEDRDATCFLPAGHEGPHEWTLDRDGLRKATITFRKRKP